MEREPSDGSGSNVGCCGLARNEVERKVFLRLAGLHPRSKDYRGDQTETLGKSLQVSCHVENGKNSHSLVAVAFLMIHQNVLSVGTLAAVAFCVEAGERD